MKNRKILSHILLVWKAAGFAVVLVLRGSAQSLPLWRTGFLLHSLHFEELKEQWFSFDVQSVPPR